MVSHGSYRVVYPDAASGNDEVFAGFHEDREAFLEVVVAGFLGAYVS